MTQQIDLALARIKPHMAVSIGGGNHMKHLADAIYAADVPDLTLTTPSEETADYARQLGLTINDHPASIDLAFDGCDSADLHGNLLKSNGAIFTYEKRNAMLADQVIILTPASKLQDKLDNTVPLTVELLDAAEPLVRQLADNYQLTVSKRAAGNYMGFTRTRDGNVLIDLLGQDWHDLATIDAALSRLPGVVATSFFNRLADVIITESTNGTAQVMRKED